MDFSIKCSTTFSCSQVFSLSCSASTGSDRGLTTWLHHSYRIVGTCIDSNIQKKPPKNREHQYLSGTCLMPPSPLQLKVLYIKMSRRAGAAQVQALKSNQ